MEYTAAYSSYSHQLFHNSFLRDRLPKELTMMRLFSITMRYLSCSLPVRIAHCRALAYAPLVVVTSPYSTLQRSTLIMRFTKPLLRSPHPALLVPPGWRLAHKADHMGNLRMTTTSPRKERRQEPRRARSNALFRPLNLLLSLRLPGDTSASTPPVSRISS